MDTRPFCKLYLDNGYLVGAALSILIFTTSIVAAAGNDTGTTSGQFRTLDERLVDVGMAAPHFGGIYLDAEAETIIVHVVEGAASLEIANVKDAVRSEFTAAELTTDQIVTIPARYSILELDEWHRRIVHNHFDLEGLVFTDMNEGRNRVEVGITEEGDSHELETRLGELDIPSEAVIITPSEPVVPELRNHHRPVVGGLQIMQSSAACTLGFTNWHFGEQAFGFVTNGHCTDGGEGVVTGTPFYQPVIGGSNLVGIEELDPPGFTDAKNCPPKRVCRYSDAAWLASVDPSAVPPTGFIATPPLQSHNWDGVSEFMITGKGDGIVGTHVQKVGRTTGRTRGVIDNTCVTVIGTPFTLLCQTRVAATDVPFSQAGDSGSPVFSIFGLQGEVLFRGIHWGNAGSEIGLFSPISGIEADLGLMRICPDDVICPPPQ